MAVRKLPKNTMRTLLRGSAAASVQAQASPRQWRKLVRTARRRGVTLDSLVSGVPTPLAQRTNASIMNQARKTVRSAYQPVFEQLSTQERQTRAIDAKRAADNQHYAEWLRTNNDALIAANNTFAQGVADRQQALANSTQQSYTTAAQGIAANNAGRTGSTTLGDQEQAAAQSSTTPQSTFAGNLMAAEQQRTLGQQTTGAGLLASTAANAATSHAASDARRSAELWRALADISGERNRYTAERASDIQREVSRLRDQEITKASSQQQLNLAAQELGAKTAQQKIDADLAARKLAETVRSNRANEGIRRDANSIRRDALNLNITTAQYRQMLADKQFKLDLRRFRAGQAKDRYLKRHRLGSYAPGGGSGGRSGLLTPADNNRYLDGIGAAQSLAQRLIDAKVDPSRIPSLLASDGSIRGTDLRWRGHADAIVSAAQELVSPGYITRATLDKLHAMGIRINGRYPVYRRYATGKAGPERADGR